MGLSDLLRSEAIIPDSKAKSKKQVLQDIAERAGSLCGIEPATIFDVLLERERLGTTGVGQGVAIPHGKFDSLDRVIGLFLRLEKPIEFDAVDEKPVDLVFALLAPNEAGADHLKALARVSRLMRDQSVVEKLRGSQSAEAMHALLAADAKPHAA
ncbi:MAG: PTS IIA-like nitrogen regulatory protein PtsN [Pseudomonadota bacterium]